MLPLCPTGHPLQVYSYPHCVSSSCPQVSESWETVPNSETGTSVSSPWTVLSTPHTCWPASPHSSPWRLALPAGPRLPLLPACPGLTELCGRDKESEQPQEGNAGLRTRPVGCPGSLLFGSHSQQLTVTSRWGKTTTTASLGPSPEPASRPQRY